ncbi:unnamed protein product [Mycena citricolor]|uniref:lipoyl(octanoyl) transferase n=1 Tax=Mycena citricolor TaxID=2018698 RepID=A0AAD2HST6_9AGAR|nr:unnamed protein product [Mycena citricolor]
MIPALYYYFRTPVHYVKALALQEHIHARQLAARTGPDRTPDILLVLQHPPVYTAGRRHGPEGPHPAGLELVRTARGGAPTYHGPGQLALYPLLDLTRPRPSSASRAPISAQAYVCALHKALQTHLRSAHGIASANTHTGVTVDARQIASVGVQVRRGLTTHGAALNVTREPLAWLGGDRHTSVESVVGRTVDVEREVAGLAGSLGEALERDFAPMDLAHEGAVGAAIAATDESSNHILEW